MAKNIDLIPFTEIVERTLQTARAESVNDRSRARGAANDEYLLNIPNKEDWTFLESSSALVCTRPYNVGTVSADTGDTTLVFSSDVVLDADFTGREVKVAGNNNVYDVTFSNTTAATISPPFSEGRNVSATSYKIYQPFYALAADFRRFRKDIALLNFQGGTPDPIPEFQSQLAYLDAYSSQPGTPAGVRLVERGTLGIQHVELRPPPNKESVYPYPYIRALSPLRETSAGTVTISAAGTTCTFQEGAVITEANTGDYIRISAFGTHADSEWYKLIAIDAANSVGTLDSAFGTSGATSAGYVISAVPRMPVLMHKAILSGAIMSIMADQNDPQFALAASDRTAVMVEARRLYKTRVYSQDIDYVAEDWNYRR